MTLLWIFDLVLFVNHIATGLFEINRGICCLMNCCIVAAELSFCYLFEFSFFPVSVRKDLSKKSLLDLLYENPVYHVFHYQSL